MSETDVAGVLSVLADDRPSALAAAQHLHALSQHVGVQTTLRAGTFELAVGTLRIEGRAQRIGRWADGSFVWDADAAAAFGSLTSMAPLLACPSFRCAEKQAFELAQWIGWRTAFAGVSIEPRGHDFVAFDPERNGQRFVAWCSLCCDMEAPLRRGVHGFVCPQCLAQIQDILTEEYEFEDYFAGNAGRKRPDPDKLVVPCVLCGRPEQPGLYSAFHGVCVSCAGVPPETPT